MHFTQFRSFQAVALEGSFTGAAERLNLSQPTITQQVGELETFFRVELFNRQGRRIELSEVGKSLLMVTERLFTTNEEAIELLESASGLGTGHLRISAVSPLDVIPVIARVAETNPRIRISLTICNSENAMQALMDFRADVTMLASAQADPRLHYVNFGSRPLVLYVRKGHAWSNRRVVRLKELQGQKMITREVGSQTRRLFEQACAKANITPGQKLEVNNRDAFREAVAHGLGIGIIGDRGLVSDDRLKRITISGVNIRMDRQLACLKERKNARLIKSFLAAGRIIANHLD